MSLYPFLNKYIFHGKKPRYTTKWPMPIAQYTQAELDGFSKLAMLQEKREALGRKVAGRSGETIPNPSG